MRSERMVAKLNSTSIAASLCVAFAALMFASCGIEAAEQTAEKSPAEKIASQFSEPPASKQPAADPNAGAASKAAQQKSDEARKAADDSKRVAAAKRTEEKARKAAAAEAAAKAKEQAKADEAEMLALARAEAEQRRVEMESASREREKADAAVIAADKANLEAEAEMKRLAEERKAKEQTAVVAAAKATEAQKQADELRAAETRRMAEEKLIADAKAAAAQREAQVAEQERAADAQRQANLQALTAKREAEAKVLAERLRSAELAREAKEQKVTPSAVATAPVEQGDPPQTVVVLPSLTAPVTTIASPPVASTTAAKALSRFAVLIVMDAGNKGIRRFEKTADPVLCVQDGCYVSEGAGKPARFQTRARVLGIGNTWGSRAGACQRSLGCTFRDVDLAASSGYLQPIDMKVLVHDRREPQTITADSDCRLEGQRLLCRRPVTASGYRMWVVPEALAERAGAPALDAALQNNLASSQSAGLAR